MSLRTVSIVLLLALGMHGTAGAQGTASSEAVERSGPGAINWTSGEVTATGIGAPPVQAPAAQARAMAERAAFVVALRNLLEVAKGVRIDAQTVVENAMVSSDVIRTRVDGIVKGARVVKKRYLSDGSVEIDVSMPFQGAFLDAVVPETFGRTLPLSKPPAAQPTPERKQVPAAPVLPRQTPAAAAPDNKSAPLPQQQKVPEKKQEPVASPAPPEPIQEKRNVPPAPQPEAPSREVPPTRVSGKATGLVIDGRGLGLRPALLPRIVDPQGQELYVGQVVTRTNAVEQGVAGYAKDVQAAANNFRVTDNPAVITAVRAAGQARTDIVVSQRDAELLRQLAGKDDFLQYCRVIIVY